jgi:DNA-binding NarL/FixJ family response regulator
MRLRATDEPPTCVVMIATDERLRGRVRLLLGGLPKVLLAGEAVDGVGAALVCALGRPDVVVMDALLPWVEAVDIVRCIRKVQVDTRIITVTVSPSLGLAAAGVTQGLAPADGAREDLASALRRRCVAPSGAPPAA